MYQLLSSVIANPADIALLNARSDDEYQRQRAMLRARAYHNGQQFVKLTDRLREFLKDPGAELDSDALRLNICRIVVTAVTERLLVKGFTSESKDHAAILWDWWQKNRMDARQSTVHTSTLRDSETFVIVSWNDALGIPRFVEHDAYTDVDISAYRRDRTAPTASDYRTGYNVGTGYGCRAYYPDDDYSQPMAFATKRWIERTFTNGRWESHNRVNIYYPDRIEKYETIGGTEKPYSDPVDGDMWPIPWVDSTGEPLGIPVIHFRNEDDRPEAIEAVPIQNAINKSLIDALTSNDFNAFRVWVALGFIPTTDGRPLATDGSNAIDVTPGGIVATTNAKDRVSFDAVNGQDPKPLLDVVNQLIFWAAAVTDTPVNRFISTAQVASDETLKGQDGPLVNKIRKRQTLLGNAWEDMMAMGVRLHNTFGAGGLNETLTITTEWEPAETRDNQKEIEIIATKRRDLGIPQETAWKEAGYTPEEITKMQAQSEAAQARVAAQTQLAMNQNTSAMRAGVGEK